MATPQKSQPAPDFIPYQPSGDTPDFIPASGGGDASTPAPPTAHMSATPAQPWLTQLDEDLRQGGSRTFVGRTLGHMQGRGDKGYTGLESGTTPATADFMGSVPLGAVKMAQGVAETPQHPIAGPLKAVSGLLQAGTIPSAFMGGPAADAAIEAAPGMAEKAWDTLVPTRAKAGKLFNKVMDSAGDQPVTISPNTMAPLERTQQLAMAGGKPFGAADKLYQRIQTINPLTYREARDFSQNMSLSPEEKMGLKKSMRYEVPRLAKSFNEDVGNAAAAAGKGEEYGNAMNMYRRASRNASIGKGLLKYGGRAALGAAGAGGLYEVGKALNK
ncbi:MAG TPA: hypothetical protein VN517_03945 [Terriglobales bacterium]|nr:hypothetical protein [Terriglobales bacterium]